MKFKLNYYHIVMFVLFVVVIKKVYESYTSSSQGAFDLLGQYIPMRNHFVPLGRMDDEMLHNPKHYG